MAKVKVKEWFEEHKDGVCNAVVGGVCLVLGGIVGYYTACVLTLCYADPKELYDLMVETQARLKEV